MYDAHEAVVCFLSDEVDGCMDEFKEEWESVSKIVVIAREGTSFFWGGSPCVRMVVLTWVV